MLNQKWSSTEKQSSSALIIQKHIINTAHINLRETSEIHPLFEYLNSDSLSLDSCEFISLFNLLSNSQEADYEELSFQQKMKRKKRRK